MAAAASSRLAEALIDFGHVARAPRIVLAEAERQLSPSHPFQTAQPGEADIAARIAAAVAAAELGLTARLNQKHAAALDVVQAGHADELAALKASLEGAVATALSGELAAMEARLIAITTASVARILGPMTGVDVANRAIAALATSISQAVSDAGAIQIKVSGPASLYDRLCAEMGERSLQFAFTETTGFDLSVSIGETHIETRLAAWAEAISEPVG